ncbi:ankyrin repeat domain-containing protein [Thalassotalea sp. HSM 43]|uniref:ankyrin repeat domain-containing protein n=1 Tax=Thalassotalea sp. HSM 43 TaxID=2552945 RepID=UPI001080C793|nr:ankyrin repeat domain-containing protein [Thalassotalea sp. HSM 43]QBY05038.1 ankyrin repeat domain-containing protein [Thalassotalea sp. HSM 43]
MRNFPLLKPKSPEQNIDIIRFSANGDRALVNEALALGCDINVSDANGVTALIVASRTGHIEVVKLLVSKGADLKLKDNFGYDAYHIAMFAGDFKGMTLEPFKTIMSVVKYI